MLSQSKPVRKRQMVRAYTLLMRRRLSRYNIQWKTFRRLNKYPVSPLKMGRMNGRCWGYKVQFAAIDEIDSYWREEDAEVLLHYASTNDRRNSE